ncbi:MAG: GntR family transcriptional regulator [Opitutales bacterium]|nr:GntR family transcriptional regulator [Opitutales bacterium]
MSFTPKYQTVLERLRREVEQAEPGVRLTPIRRMMATYKVSQSAIERCLDELEREGLVARRRGSGVYVNDIQTKNHVVGIYSDSEVAPHSHARFLEGIRDTVERFDFHAADFGPRDIFDEPHEVLSTMQQMGFAGIIAELSTSTFFHLENEDLLRKFRELQLPIVTCLPLPGIRADSVMPDHFSAFRKLGEYFREHCKGPVKFLCYHGIPSLARLQGFQVGLGKNGGLEIETLEKQRTTVFKRAAQLCEEGWEGNLVIGVPPDYPSDLELLNRGPWTKDYPFDLAVLLETGEVLPAHLAAHIVLKRTRRLGESAAKQLIKRVRGFRGEMEHKVIPHEVYFADKR